MEWKIIFKEDMVTGVELRLKSANELEKIKNKLYCNELYYC